MADEPIKACASCGSEAGFIDQPAEYADNRWPGNDQPAEYADNRWPGNDQPKTNRWTRCIACGASSGAGFITAGTITADSSANAAGTAAFARYFKTGGVTAGFQGLRALTSGGDFNIATSLASSLGANVSCSAATITMLRE